MTTQKYHTSWGVSQLGILILREREMGLCEYPQEAEESNVQMAQKFVSLCTSILQVWCNNVSWFWSLFSLLLVFVVVWSILSEWLVFSLIGSLYTGLQQWIFFSLQLVCILGGNKQVAGISQHGKEMDQSLALEGLKQIEDRLQSMEQEISDLKLKVMNVLNPKP